MRLLGVTLTADDYAQRLPAWVVDAILLYEIVRVEYEASQRDA